MAKLLKHFGIGYGSNKKSSETFDFRAKTLPASTADRSSVLASGDSVKSPAGRRNGGARSHTVDCGDAAVSSHPGRRASNETFLTIPARGLRARGDRDWFSRGTKNKEPAFGSRSQDSESKARCDADPTKDLRRSLTADEISSKKSNRITPAVSMKTVSFWGDRNCFQFCGFTNDRKRQIHFKKAHVSRKFMCLSIRLSVHPSQAGIVSKRLDGYSCFFAV